jgi:WD40 repeat protein
MTISPCGQYIATSSADAELDIWDVKQHGCCPRAATLTRFSNNEIMNVDIYCVGFNSTMLAAGTRLGSVVLFQMGTWRVTRVLDVHAGVVCTVSLWGEKLASGSNDCMVKMTTPITHDAATTSINMPHRGCVSAVMITELHGVISGSWDGTIVRWDIAAQPEKRQCVHQAHDGKHVLCMNVARDAPSTLMSGGGDCMIRVWNLPDLSPLRTIVAWKNPMSWVRSITGRWVDGDDGVGGGGGRGYIAATSSCGDEVKVWG